MASLACRSLPIILLTLHCCSGSGEKTFEVYISSEKQVVEATESWKVNCSTSCEKPQLGGLETTMSKIVLEKHPQGKWTQFLVSNITSDTQLYCYFTCADQQQRSAHLHIKLYQVPAQVTLMLQPPRVIVGENFTIKCNTSAVKPLESLTLTLLRGREILHNQTFGGAEHEATVTFNSTALTKEGLNFSCRAELDLRPHGGHITRTMSKFQTLEVFEPIQDNQMLIIIVVVSILLFLFVTSVLLCFILGQHWHRHRTGTYGVLAAWRRLPRAFRQRPG
ncbi:intercellular adhesion molecule 2 isoform X1 [Sigmodon hispidus]